MYLSIYLFIYLCVVAFKDQPKACLPLRQVTQRFFDAVSAQLERWYERKVAEVEREAEVKGRRDMEELQQQVEELEEELRRLKTSGNAET